MCRFILKPHACLLAEGLLINFREFYESQTLQGCVIVRERKLN